MANEIARPITTTQIRSFYADGICYLNVSFYNMHLQLKFCPFIGKDTLGKSSYDTSKTGSRATTMKPEAAYALYHACKDIVDGKIAECTMIIPCSYNAQIILERKTGQNAQLDTTISIMRDGLTITYPFPTLTEQVIVNGKPQTKVIETGIGALMKTLEGYLTGINAERHLNKYTEDYAKYMAALNQQNQQQNQQRPQYPQQQQQHGGYKKNYNGYRKPYGQNNGRQNWNNNPPQQQGMSDYQLPQ